MRKIKGGANGNPTNPQSAQTNTPQSGSTNKQSDPINQQSVPTNTENEKLEKILDLISKLIPISKLNKLFGIEKNLDKRYYLLFVVTVICSISTGGFNVVLLIIFIFIARIIQRLVWGKESKTNIGSLKNFITFFTLFTVFILLNFISIWFYYELALERQIYNETFSNYQIQSGYDLANSDFLNYILTDITSSQNQNLFSKLKNDNLAEFNKFKDIYEDKILSDESLFKINGLEASDISNMFKYDKPVLLNTNVDLENLDKLDTEEKFHRTIAKHILNFTQEINTRQGDISNKKGEKWILRWILYYPLQSNYYSITVGSTVGFGDIYPKGLFPKIVFMFFAFFVLIFLAYEVFT